MTKDEELWYRSKVKHESYSILAKELGCSKNKIKLDIAKVRWDRGEIVISRYWLIRRINRGCTNQMMADEMFCSVRTIQLKRQQHNLNRPRGNPNF